MTIISSLLGYQALSLTNLTTSAESQIAAGSKVEIASAFFTFASDEQPSGWSSITTAATAYITLTPSGTAGSQIVSAAYTETAPEWSDSKQGWYASAASSTRYVGKVTKTSATQYDNKRILFPLQGNTGPVIHAESVDVTGDVDVGGDVDVTGELSNGSNNPSLIGGGRASGFYTGSTADETDLPIGSVIAVVSGVGDVIEHARNEAISPRLHVNGGEYTTGGGGALLSGTWRTRGRVERPEAESSESQIFLAQRVS